jgi:hypothetical protein
MADSQPEDNLPTVVDTPTDPPASGAETPPVVPRPTTESTDTAPSAPPQDANSNRRDHPTNKSEWLRSSYMSAYEGATDVRDPGTMTVGDFSKIKISSGEHAYWQDSHINWALELIHRKYAELEGVVITPTPWCSQLYVAGMNPNHIGPIDSSDYRSNWAHMADTLRNGTIVVLPVNNGYRGTEETEKAYNKASETIEKAKETAKTANEEAEKAEDEANKATKDAERADKEAREADEADDKAEEAVKEAKDAAKKANEAAQEKDSAAKNKRQTAGEADKALKKANDGSLSGYLGSGGHWSYIVVDRRDTENPRAHYVDSLVSPEPRPNGRWAVAGIQYNGRVAGIVLRGFDRLLGLPEDGFEAHTLKFVPHQRRNNAYKRDSGPCGPHVYAFLDHILGSKTTLIDPGMHTTFNVAATRARRAKDFNFNSLTARSRFAEHLFTERKRYEERRPDLAVSNLTPGVLDSVMTADGVIYLATGSASGSDNDKDNDNDNDNVNDDDDDGESTFGEPPIPKSFLRDLISKNPETFKGMSLEDCYPIVYNLSVEEQAKHDLNTIYLGRNRYRNVPRDDTNIFPPLAADDEYKKPAKMTNIPDFETVRQPTLKTWFNANFEQKDRPDYKSKNWETECRARLHVKIKKSLLGQSDHDLEEVWSKDRAVFDPNNTEYTNLRKEFEKKEDKRPMYGVMRGMLMRHYMTKEAVDELLKILEKFKVKEPAAGDKRKRDGPDNSGNRGKRAKHSKGGPGGTKPQDFQTIANEDINFKSMEIGNVLLWWNKVLNQGCTDFLGSRLTIEQARACLHRAFNGKFTRKNLDKDTAGILRRKIGMDRNLGYDHILEELNTLTDDVHPLPKQLEWYPDYYLLERNTTPAENSNEDSDEDGVDLDPEHDADSLSGSSGSGDDDDSGGDDGLRGKKSSEADKSSNKARSLHDPSHRQPLIPPLLDFHNIAPAEVGKQDTSKRNNTEQDQSKQSKPEEKKPEEK